MALKPISLTLYLTIFQPEHQELLQSSPIKTTQRLRYVNGQIKVEKLQNNKVIKRTYILGSIVFFFMLLHSGRFGLRVSVFHLFYSIYQ